MHYDPNDSEDIHLYLHNSKKDSNSLGESYSNQMYSNNRYNLENNAARHNQERPIQPVYNTRSKPNADYGLTNRRQRPYKQSPYQQTYPHNSYAHNAYYYNRYPNNMYSHTSYPTSAYRPDYNQLSKYRSHSQIQQFASPNAYAPSIPPPSACGSKLMFGCSPHVQEIPCTSTGQYRPINQYSPILNPYDPYQQYRMFDDNAMRPELAPITAPPKEPALANANKQTSDWPTNPIHAKPDSISNNIPNRTPATYLAPEAKPNNDNKKFDIDLSKFAVPAQQLSSQKIPNPAPNFSCPSSGINQDLNVAQQTPVQFPSIPAYSPSYVVPTPSTFKTDVSMPKSSDSNTNSISENASNTNSTSNAGTSETTTAATSANDESNKLPTTPEHIVGSTHMGSQYNPSDKLITTPAHLLQNYQSQPAQSNYGASNYQHPGIMANRGHEHEHQPYPNYRPHSPNYNSNYPGAWN